LPSLLPTEGVVSDWLAEQLRRLRAMERERREREDVDLIDWSDVA